MESFGNLHPIIVHFPIVLLSLGLFCDLLNGIGKTSALAFAHWVIIGGAILCIPAVVTGLAAESSFTPDHPFVATHKILGFITAAIACIHALFRFTVMRKNWQLPPLVYVGCSLLTVILLAMTADYGGRVTHGTSPFTWW